MDALDSVIASNVLLGQDYMQPLDAYGDITVQHFVDLLSGAHDDRTLPVLVDAIISLVSRSEVNLEGYGAVVSPKMGNVLLCKAVAQRLSKPSGFVRGSILFGKYIETLELPGTKLLLVDDVSSEAKILTESVRNARESGYVIDVVYTVVDRSEGDAARRLGDLGVRLHAARRYSDRDLAELVRSWKRQSEHF